MNCLRAQAAGLHNLVLHTALELSVPGPLAHLTRKYEPLAG
jgi:hypothetical protein